MDHHARVSLEQWRAFVAVVDAGGYAQAAEKLSKSQSAVSYAVQQIESLLGLKAFEIQGRRAVLTPTGHLLHRRAQALLDEAAGVEHAGRSLAAGWEAEITIAVEIIFPIEILLKALERLALESPHTRIEIIESVLGGTPEALLEGRAQLVVSGQIPPGFIGHSLMRLRIAPTAHPNHPLHQLGRELTLRDLRAHRHLVVRDSGSKRTAASNLLEAKQRWTFSHLASSVDAAKRGYGFAWYVQDRIQDEIRRGELKELPLSGGGDRFVELYLIVADPEGAGPGVLRLAQLLSQEVAGACSAHKGDGA